MVWKPYRFTNCTSLMPLRKWDATVHAMQRTGGERTQLHLFRLLVGHMGKSGQVMISWYLMMNHQSESDDLETQWNTFLAELPPFATHHVWLGWLWRCSFHRIPLRTGSSGLKCINIVTKTRTNTCQAAYTLWIYVYLREEHLCSNHSHSSLYKLKPKKYSV